MRPYTELSSDPRGSDGTLVTAGLPYTEAQYGEYSAVQTFAERSGSTIAPAQASPRTSKKRIRISDKPFRPNRAICLRTSSLGSSLVNHEASAKEMFRDLK